MLGFCVYVQRSTHRAKYQTSAPFALMSVSAAIRTTETTKIALACQKGRNSYVPPYTSLPVDWHLIAVGVGRAPTNKAYVLYIGKKKLETCTKLREIPGLPVSGAESGFPGDLPFSPVYPRLGVAAGSWEENQQTRRSQVSRNRGKKEEKKIQKLSSTQMTLGGSAAWFKQEHSDECRWHWQEGTLFPFFL